jgi:hypothetical protein
MKTKFKMIVLLSFSALIYYSCAPPDAFLLNRKEPVQIYGLIMSDLESVEQVRDNALYLLPGTMVALKVESITQLAADFTCELRDGEGITFAFRTISDNYEQQNKITFEYTTNGCIVRENNRLITKVDSIKAVPNEQKLIRILNEGKAYSITVDCDTVVKARTELCATEYVIIKSLKGTEAVLSGIDICDVKDKFIIQLK